MAIKFQSAVAHELFSDSAWKHLPGRMPASFKALSRMSSSPTRFALGCRGGARRSFKALSRMSSSPTLSIAQ